MVNRKENKSANRAGHGGRPRGRPASDKTHRPYRRFVISRKAHSHKPLPAQAPAVAPPKPDTATLAKTAYANTHEAAGTGKHAQVVDLTETIRSEEHTSELQSP